MNSCRKYDINSHNKVTEVVVVVEVAAATVILV